MKDMTDAMKGMLKVAGQSVTAINVTGARIFRELSIRITHVKPAALGL